VVVSTRLFAADEDLRFREEILLPLGVLWKYGDLFYNKVYHHKLNFVDFGPRYEDISSFLANKCQLIGTSK